jgi:hypothetical protein
VCGTVREVSAVVRARKTKQVLILIDAGIDRIIRSSRDLDE